MSNDVMDKAILEDIPAWLVHPNNTLKEDYDLAHRVHHYRRPIRTNAPVSPSVAELMNRGHELLGELETAHLSLLEAATEALSPSPQSWKAVRSAMTSYTAIYAELNGLSKRLNQLIQAEAPELLTCNPPEDMTGMFGVV